MHLFPSHYTTLHNTSYWPNWQLGVDIVWLLLQQLGENLHSASILTCFW